MDLVALDIFCAVAREGSVTRAAEALQRAQSSVTTRVQQLEEDLGVTLFLREGRRMTLTAEGETLQGYAQRLLALADEARQALLPGRPGGRLRLGTMESTAASRLPAPLARLHARWPDVRLELRTGPSRTLIDAVAAHAIDCALVALPPGTDELHATLEATPVFTESLLLALPPGHPRVKSAAGLQVGTLAAFAPGCTYRQIGETWMTRDGTAPRVLELASYHAILACVAGGSCAGVIPRSVLALMAAPPDLQLLPLQDCDTMLLQRRGYRSAALEALRGELAVPTGDALTK